MSIPTFMRTGKAAINHNVSVAINHNVSFSVLLFQRDNKKDCVICTRVAVNRRRFKYSDSLLCLYNFPFERYDILHPCTKKNT